LCSSLVGSIKLVFVASRTWSRCSSACNSIAGLGNLTLLWTYLDPFDHLQEPMLRRDQSPGPSHIIHQFRRLRDLFRDSHMYRVRESSFLRPISQWSRCLAGNNAELNRQGRSRMISPFRRRDAVSRAIAASARCIRERGKQCVATVTIPIQASASHFPKTAPFPIQED
jgi:hypothetical protein